MEGVKEVKCDWQQEQVIVVGEDGLDLPEMLAKWVSVAPL